MGRKKMGNVRRAQILAALYDCLAETAYENISVKKLAERAGVSHGIIHYYFKDKDEIVEALMLSIVEKYEARLATLIEQAPLAKPSIQTLLDHFLDDFIFDVRLNKVFINLIQMSFDREKIREYLHRYLSIWRENVLKVVEYNDYPPHEAKMAAYAVTALIDGLGMHWIIDRESMNKEDIKEMFNYVGESMGFMLA
jgi:TetR/AcrR family transcriptional regulator, transcriptional repressor of bet genes